MGKRPHGVPPIRCSARNRQRERCGQWAVPGTIVCRHHGGYSPQAVRLASVRLTLGELARTDPRSLREVLADAVHLADLAQRDYLGAVQHGEADTATVGRMLESARYAATLAKIALDSGAMPLDAAPAPGLVRTDDALAAVVPAVMATMADALAEAVGQSSAEDVQWRQAILDWLGPAMGARVTATPSG